MCECHLRPSVSTLRLWRRRDSQDPVGGPLSRPAHGNSISRLRCSEADTCTFSAASSEPLALPAAVLTSHVPVSTLPAGPGGSPRPEVPGLGSSGQWGPENQRASSSGRGLVLGQQVLLSPVTCCTCPGQQVLSSARLPPWEAIGLRVSCALGKCVGRVLSCWPARALLSPCSGHLSVALL